MRPRAAIPRSRFRAIVPRATAPSRSWLWPALGGFGLLIGAVVLIFLYFWRQDVALREYARARISAETPDPAERALLLVLAEFHHVPASNLATPRDSRGRRAPMPEKKAYYKVLMALVRESRAQLEEQEPPTEATLSGGWLRYDAKNGFFYVVNFKRDGNYVRAVFLETDCELRDVHERTVGTWNVRSGVLTWHYKGKVEGNAFVKFTRHGFVLREKDGSLTYWRLYPIPSELNPTLQ